MVIAVIKMIVKKICYTFNFNEWKFSPFMSNKNSPHLYSHPIKLLPKMFIYCTKIISCLDFEKIICLFFCTGYIDENGKNTS